MKSIAIITMLVGQISLASFQVAQVDFQHSPLQKFNAKKALKNDEFGWKEKKNINKDSKANRFRFLPAISSGQPKSPWHKAL